MDYDDTSTNKQTNDQPAISSSTLCDFECCGSHRKEAPFLPLTSRDIKVVRRNKINNFMYFRKHGLLNTNGLPIA